MTREEYDERVKDAATTLLTETEAKDWKEENPDGDFWEFENDVELYDNLHPIIDSTCESDWEGAIEVLQNSDQDADAVDPGLYEGCDWRRILVVLAFEVYSWDVREKAEEMFDNEEFDEYMMPIQSNARQIGHFPELQGYKIPKGRWVVNLRSAIKVLVTGRDYRNPDLSVVFEGEVTERASSFIVKAKRVYTQGGKDANIQDDLERCREEFGVQLFPESGAAD